jgi:Ca2+-binding EF-hand superfamily protein
MAKITLNEFVDMMIQKAQATNTTMQAFAAFDKNKDGFITAEELQLGMQQLGTQMTDEQIAAMIRAVDKDADGKVDFKEFSQMFQS